MFWLCTRNDLLQNKIKKKKKGRKQKLERAENKEKVNFNNVFCGRLTLLGKN